MFSDQIYLDVVGLIDCVLDQMPTPEVIDEITIVQGYLQLSLGEHGLYDGKVQVGLDALLKLARHEDKQGLIHALQDVLEAMDREQDT